MTIRFAAARGGTNPSIGRALCPSAPLSASNDNRPDRARRTARWRASNDADTPFDERLLADALYHFARHGLAAAARARTQAETAAAAGDGPGRDRWIAICRQLDRRMADACARNLCRKT